jgi:polyisoprenoid-binding protein YceI
MTTSSRFASCRLLLAAAAAAAVPGAVQAAGYFVDPTHTTVGFEALHFGTSTTRVRFDKKEGTIVFDRVARTGRVEISVDTASVNSGVAPFDKQLRGKDFFDVTEHPTATFVSERLVFAGDKVSEVVGTLTLLGKTHPVTLKAMNFNCYTNPIFKREVCGGDFEAVVQRSLWGLRYGLPAVAPDNVRLVIQVEAIRQ